MQAAAMPTSDPRPPLSGFPLAPGVRLGKFEIVRELASGGMGKVYIARDTLTDVAVALKVLITAPEAEPGRLERFKRESMIGWRRTTATSSTSTTSARMRASTSSRWSSSTARTCARG